LKKELKETFATLPKPSNADVIKKYRSSPKKKRKQIKKIDLKNEI